MKKRKQLAAISLAIMIMTMNLLGTSSNFIIAKAATFDEINNPDVFLKQVNGDKQCTLVAVTMLLRRAAMLSGNSNWADITVDSVKKEAWVDSVGLKYTFTYAGFTVNKASFQKDHTKEAIELLQQHPEGIVLYDQYKKPRSHAVLLTDYTDNTFYCADPSDAVPYGRIPISQGLVKVEDSEFYYYISSPSIPSPAASMTGSVDSWFNSDALYNTETMYGNDITTSTGNAPLTDSVTVTDNLSITETLAESGIVTGTDALTKAEDLSVPDTQPEEVIPETFAKNETDKLHMAETFATADNSSVTDISAYEFEFSQTVFFFDGNEKKPAVTIAGLVENIDYSVSYLNNVNPGTAVVIITGIGNYSGTIIKAFEINEAIDNYFNNITVELTKQTIQAGKTAKVKVNMPEVLTSVKEFSKNDQNSENEYKIINEVKVSYSSSNSKIAKINSNGKITGKKKGSANITVTVELADGTKKDFKLKIKVK